MTKLARGGSVLDSKVVEGLLAATSREKSSPLDELTERKIDALREMATGRSNASIAKALIEHSLHASLLCSASSRVKR